MMYVVLHKSGVKSLKSTALLMGEKTLRNGGNISTDKPD